MEQRHRAMQAVNPLELLSLHKLSKRFPNVLALDGVNFDLRRGEVHAQAIPSELWHALRERGLIDVRAPVPQCGA